MIEKLLYDYLNSVLKVPAYMEEPENPPEKYVLIEKTGSSEVDYISFAMIAVQSYGISLYETALLNEDIKKAMRDLVLFPRISKCKLNSDYNFTDTQTKRYRYQAVFEITYYEE